MSVIERLLNKFNDGSAVKFSEKNIFNDVAGWVHTGCPELDFNLGVLGFPVGITEIAGKSRSGKTTLALSGMKQFQKENPDGLCVILSSEERDNKVYAERIGIDTDKVLIIKSKFVEDLFYKLQLLLDETLIAWKEEGLPGKPKIYVTWDSLGATLARAELETFKENVKNTEKAMAKGTKGETKHATVGAFAKQAKMCMKAMLAQIYELDIIFVILNHTQANIGGHGRKSGGGEWIEYLPCLRLETILTENEKIDDVEVAQYTKIKVVKNDFGSRKATVVEVLLGYGLVLNEEDIEYAITRGILKKEGAKKISFMNGKITWNSKRTFYSLYQTNNKFLNVLHTKIKAARHKDVLKSKKVDSKDEE